MAGQHGPLECVVLYACSTVKMGRLLRQEGVPYVVCWKTQVQNETARELCERFICSPACLAALVEDWAGKRDYNDAFIVCTDAMLRHSPARCTRRTRGTSDVVLFLRNDDFLLPYSKS